MHSRRALMTGAAGLMAAVAGCTDIVGGENDVLLDIAGDNLTDEELTAQIVVEDGGDEIYNEEFDIDVSDDERALLVQDVIEAQDGAELTIRVILPDHATQESNTFTIDCSEEDPALNDEISFIIRSTDEIEFSYRNCE